MDPALLQAFWNEARLQLLNFHAKPSSGDDAADLAALATRLESEARRIDTNRRTSPYNLPSLTQEAMTKVIGDTMYVAKLWVKAGRPPVPTV